MALISKDKSKIGEFIRVRLTQGNRINFVIGVIKKNVLKFEV